MGKEDWKINTERREGSICQIEDLQAGTRGGREGHGGRRQCQSKAGSGEKKDPMHLSTPRASQNDSMDAPGSPMQLQSKVK